jgi:hypothetical protein
MPPAKGKDGADCVGKRIPRIGGGARNESRADPFKENRPKCEAKNNFSGARHLVMRAKAKEPLDQEQRGNGAGDQKEVIKMTADER